VGYACAVYLFIVDPEGCRQSPTQTTKSHFIGYTILRQVYLFQSHIPVGECTAVETTLWQTHKLLCRRDTEFFGPGGLVRVEFAKGSRGVGPDRYMAPKMQIKSTTRLTGGVCTLFTTLHGGLADRSLVQLRPERWYFRVPLVRTSGCVLRANSYLSLPYYLVTCLQQQPEFLEQDYVQPLVCSTPLQRVFRLPDSEHPLSPVNPGMCSHGLHYRRLAERRVILS